jgi:hypothetical protein
VSEPKHVGTQAISHVGRKYWSRDGESELAQRRMHGGDPISVPLPPAITVPPAVVPAVLVEITFADWSPIPYLPA